MKIPIQQKYFKSFDNTKIGYQVIGNGKTPFVLCNGLGGNSIAWSPLYNKLGRQFKFVTWDYRGLFTSEKPLDPKKINMVHHCQDLDLLLKKEKITRAIFGGWSMGVQVCLDYYRKHSKKYRGMILINGTYGKVLNTALNSTLTKHLVPTINRLLISALPTLQPRIQPLAKQVINSKDFIAIVAKLGLIHKNLDSKIFKQVASSMIQTDLAFYLQLMNNYSNHDASDVLTKIKVPTLIITGTKDIMTPSKTAHEMAKKIPNSELLVIPEASHYSLLEFPEVILSKLKLFLHENL